jgi:glucose dehydrogenase
MAPTRPKAAALGSLFSLLAMPAVLLAQPVIENFTPVTDAMLENPDPADWLMWRRTQDSWGYSPLEQIDRSNVNQLQLVWSRPLHDGVQEGTPLVYDGVLYFPNPNFITQAIDAATGDLIWEHRRSVPDGCRRLLPGAVHQPQHCHLWQSDSRQRRRRLGLCNRRTHRRAGLGVADSRLPRSGRRTVPGRSSAAARCCPGAAASRVAARKPA